MPRNSDSNRIAGAAMPAEPDQQNPPCLHCAIADAIRAYADAGHPLCLGAAIQALTSVLMDVIDIHSDDPGQRRAAYRAAIKLIEAHQPQPPQRAPLHLVPPAGQA